MKKEDIIKNEFINKSFGILEKVERLKMAARPIYPYDMGIICALLDVKPGKKVLEAGTGSGGSALFFSHLGADVTTYEINQQFFKIAKENLKNTTIKCELGDVCKAKGKFDTIFLDLQHPAEYIKKLKKNLVEGGNFGVYTPIFDDIKPVWLELEKIGKPRAILLDSKEIIVKKYARILGPLGFSGFFIWAQPTSV